MAVGRVASSLKFGKQSEMNSAFSGEEEQEVLDEVVRDRAARYSREVDLGRTALQKKRSELPESASQVRKKRLLDPLPALIAAKQGEEARRKAEVEARIQEAVEKAIAGERALTKHYQRGG